MNRYGISFDELSEGLRVRTINGKKGIIQSLNQGEKTLEVQFSDGYSSEVHYHKINGIEPFPDEDTECKWK